MYRPTIFAAVLAAVLVASPALARVQTKTLAFAPGASSGTASGSLVRGDRDHYVIGARKGQTLSAAASAAERNAAFQLYLPGWKLDADGFPTGACVRGAGEGDDASSWKGALPASGKYLLVVSPTRGNAAYKLTVGIR